MAAAVSASRRRAREHGPADRGADPRRRLSALGLEPHARDAPSRSSSAARRSSARRTRRCASADVCVTSLADDDAFEDVVLGEHGVLAGARPGTTLVDMSTISVAASRARRRARGAGRRRLPARAGERQPGRRPRRDADDHRLRPRGPRGRRFEPLLEAIGPTVLYVGEGERGAGRQARPPDPDRRHGRAARRGARARRGGRSRPREAARGDRRVGGRLARSSSTRPSRCCDDDYSATFTTAMMLKDIELVLDLAARARRRRCPFAEQLQRPARGRRRARARGPGLHRALPPAAGSARHRRQQRQGQVSQVTTNIASRGATMAVDWEQRIDFAKLRADRLARAKAALAASDLGALLLFDPNNIRYVTSTAHRRVGAGQERPLGAAPARPRPDPVGLRLGRAPPPAVRAVAAGGELPRRRRPDARRDAGRDRHPRHARAEDPARAARARPRGRAARDRHVRPGHDRRRCSARASASPTARA